MPLRILLDYDRGLPVYRQIYEAVLSALAAGNLDHDEQLPTIHDLAAELEINPNTVARAYRELEGDGYIVGKRGVGTFPAEAPDVSAADRESILRSIFDRAVGEAARHRIGVEEIIRYFRKATR